MLINLFDEKLKRLAAAMDMPTVEASGTPRAQSVRFQMRWFSKESFRSKPTVF
ncbi:hypothetical protein [Stieleria marina]|uniref:hypothetical protein n=1 Tax=Stieleria marina TaxID=1930275 RepID=UPI003AF3522A